MKNKTNTIDEVDKKLHKIKKDIELKLEKIPTSLDISEYELILIDRKLLTLHETTDEVSVEKHIRNDFYQSIPSNIEIDDLRNIHERYRKSLISCKRKFSSGDKTDRVL